MSTCSSCGAAIIWAVTAKGRNIPLDAQTVAGGNILLVEDAVPPLAVVLKKGEYSDVDVHHVTHFTTCPNAAGHRR